MPKRSQEVLPGSENVNILHLIRKEKNHVLRWLKSRVKTNLCEIVKKDKENHC